jgi:hypothetical protein
MKVHQRRGSSPGVSAAQLAQAIRDGRQMRPNPQIGNSFRHQSQLTNRCIGALSVIHPMKTATFTGQAAYSSPSYSSGASAGCGIRVAHM